MVIAASAFAKIENSAVITLINTAANHLSNGAFDQATDALERALRIDPNNPRLWHYLAQLHYQRGDYELARNMARKSSTLVADDAGMRAQNAWLTAVADQALQRRSAGTDVDAGIQELAELQHQVNEKPNEELAALKQELSAERERNKQLLKIVNERAVETNANELLRLSSQLEQELAKRRTSEEALAVAEEESQRLLERLHATRADLENANKQLTATKKARQATAAALQKSLAQNSQTSQLKQESAKRRKSEKALAAADEASQRLRNQLNTARTDLENANRQPLQRRSGGKRKLRYRNP